jgi:hypothetical protein
LPRTRRSVSRCAPIAVQAGAQPVSQPPVPDFAAADDERFCALIEPIANHLIFDEASVQPAAA